MSHYNKNKGINSFLDMVKVISLCVIVFVVASGGFYACEILPMEECMKEHSFAYCHKLLNRN